MPWPSQRREVLPPELRLDRIEGQQAQEGPILGQPFPDMGYLLLRDARHLGVGRLHRHGRLDPEAFAIVVPTHEAGHPR